MTLAHPQFLWLLALPAALLLATSFFRAKAASSTPHPKIPRASIRNWSLVIGHWSFQRRPYAAILSLSLLALALARPQGATISTPSFTQARDVLVAVDVSRSMLADDVAPNRLARAQLLVRNLADELRGERLGLLPFAGTAFLQSPLSADYEIFRTFLDELGPDMIPAGGSDFAALLRAADEAFGPADPDSGSSLPAPGSSLVPAPDRFLIVLSDGEAENESWRPLADKLAERGVRILALGLGTPAGAMIPDGSGGLVKDERGAVVLSRLNPGTLQDLARLTDGSYRDASAWVDLPALLRDTIARGRATRVATDTAPRREELFAWFLAPALALLALSLVREFPVAPRPKRVSTQTLRPPTPRSANTLARALPFALTLHWSLVIGHWSCQASEPGSLDAAEGGADPLVSLVEKLASAPTLEAPELSRLATLTAEQGEAARAAATSPAPAFPEGAVRDALAAVSAGQAADPRAADWPALRQRLEALLAPPPRPPEQPQQNQQKSDPQKSQPSDSKQKPEDQPSSSNPEKSPSSEKPKDSSSSEKSPNSSSSSPSDSSQGSDSADAAKPSPSDASKPLGDLSKPDEKKDAASESSSSAAPREEPPPPDQPTQQVGGVSTSGRPSDRDSAAAQAELDPALIVPQQRLDRVRDNDAPARLFQLLQESENPEARERPAPGAKQTW